MEPVRPLRDIFAGLAEQPAGPEDAGSSTPDPQSLLAEYHDLPGDLLITAIGSYADTAPAEVAEHLAGFVAEPGADPVDGLNLLTSAPAGVWEDEVDLSGAPGAEGVEAGLDLDDLGTADDLDLSETGPGHGFEDHFGPGFEHDTENGFEHSFGDDGFGDDDGQVDNTHQDSNGLDTFGPDHEVRTEIPTDANPEADHAAFATDVTADDASDHLDGDYFDHPIADHPTDHHMDADDLDDLQGLDDFDA
jgi:hypothetical protein